MKRDSQRSIRLAISISPRHTNPEKWMAKAKKLLEKLDYRKGAYRGEFNLSLMVIRLIEEKFTNMFGNDDPSEIKINPYSIVKIPEVKKDMDERFLKKIRLFGDKRMLYIAMRNYILKILEGIEHDSKNSV